MTDTTCSTSPAVQRLLLHVGCGRAGRARLPACFHGPQWREIRLDIDPQVQPDIVGTITDLALLADASVDALWSSHNLEHLDSFDVPRALAEFRRVLKDDGFALISVPDLGAVARRLVQADPDQILYQSAAGPISALDVLFGHQASLAAGNGYMAHRTGFTSGSLGRVLLAAGFAEVRVHEGRHWDLWAVAAMPDSGAGLFDTLAGILP